MSLHWWKYLSLIRLEFCICCPYRYIQKTDSKIHCLFFMLVQWHWKVQYFPIVMDFCYLLKEKLSIFSLNCCLYCQVWITAVCRAVEFWLNTVIYWNPYSCWEILFLHYFLHQIVLFIVIPFCFLDKKLIMSGPDINPKGFVFVCLSICLSVLQFVCFCFF